MMMKLFSSLENYPTVKSIHISHKTKGSFFHWNMASLCWSKSFKYSYSVVFDKDLYPGYQNKKVKTQKGGFPTSDAKVYVFCRDFEENDGSEM